MKRSETIGGIAAALSAAQGQIKSPQRNKKVSVRTKAGGSYEFEYADLSAIHDAIRGALSANGLAYTQTLERDEGNKYRLETTLMHSSGEYITSETPLLVEEGGNQQFGSALTFMKRYALAALVGVAADSDDDANSADGNEAKIEDRKPRKPKAPPPSVVEPIDIEEDMRPEPPPSDGNEPPVPLVEEDESYQPQLIPVPMLPDGSGSDWITWGKEYIGTIRACDTTAEADAWLLANKEPLKEMTNSAKATKKRLDDAVFSAYQTILKKGQDNGIQAG